MTWIRALLRGVIEDGLKQVQCVGTGRKGVHVGSHDPSGTKRAFFAYFHSPAHAVEVHRANFGPTIRAFEEVDADAQ